MRRTGPDIDDKIRITKPDKHSGTSQILQDYGVFTVVRVEGIRVWINTREIPGFPDESFVFDNEVEVVKKAP